MTNARRTGVATQLSLVVVMALAAALSVGLLPAPPADAQVSSLPIQFSDVSIFATNSVRTDNNAQIMSGHVVANTASPGPTLTSGFELALGKGTTTPAGYAIVGDSIQVGNNAVVGGNAFYNNLSNSGTINGTLNTPISLPVFSPLPEFHVAVPGTQDVTVGSNQTVTLAPGAYRDVSVQNNGILELGPGVYDVRSITMSNNARIRFLNLASGKVDVRVLNQVTTNGVVASDDNDPLKAKNVIFYVAYASGANLTPAAVTLTGTFNANVYAPNGTVRLNDGVRATGAFLGRDIDVGSGARVELETFFTQQAPAITSANATTFTVGQAGSFTVTTTGFPTPSITRSGAALPSGVTFTDNGDGTGTLSGTPDAGTGGTYAITFTASNGVPPDAVQNFTLTVNQAPAITSANTTTFTVGTAGSFTVTTSGFPTPSITRGGATLPSGVSFVDNGNGTGTLSGTPAAGTGGNYAITFTATNTEGSSPTQSFTLVVNQAPVITSANSTTFIVGQAGSFTVTTTGFPAPSITRGGAALPAGVNFVDNLNGTGTLSGTPAAGTAGNYAITFTATNTAGSSPTQNFTLTVAQAPTITSANATTFTVGQAGSFTVTTTGFPPASISQGGATLPSGVTFVSNGDGTGTLSGTPAAGTGGVYAITFTATNTAGSSPTQNFTLTVNQAPAITSANTTTFTVGQPGSFTVTTTGFPTPSIAQGGALPSGVNFVDNGNGTGTLSGTPAAGSGGSYTLTFTASNGVPPNALQNFTLGVNAPPTAVNDGPYLTDANTTFSRATSDPDDLLDNDSLGFPVATLTSFGGGSLGGTVTSNAAGATATFGTGGSLTVQSNGAFTFTPENGFTGAFTFQYRLTNAGGTSDATVTINVRPKATLDIFLEAVVGNVVVNTATGTVFSVLTNDVYNGSVIVSGSSFSTNGGTVSVNPSTGTFTYDPPVGFQGSDSFTYTITDSSGFTSAPAAVSVTVGGMIWFVNNNSGACSSTCDGRMTHPFTTLQAFTSVNDGVGTHPANNQNVFVYESATSYTFSSGTLLRTGQKLIGQDATATLASIAGVTVPSGSSLPAMNTGGNATTIGSTVALAGSSLVRGLTISTGASAGLTGGAVSGVAVSETHVATTSGTAVNLNGTAGAVSLTSVSANGALNGIVLANTTGSFAVTGDAGSANNGSGGTIQNTTSHAVSLTSAQNVSFDQLNISGAGDSGVNGTDVTNFAFTNGTVSNVGNAGFESAIAFNGSGTGLGLNIAGTLTVTGNTFTSPFVSGLDVRSNAGTVTSANISNNTITNPGFSGINLVGTGNATTSFSLNGATIDQNNISGSGGNGIQVSIGNSNTTGPGATAGIPNDASNIVAITNNSITLLGSGTQAIAVANSGGNSGSRTQTHFRIECNGRNTGGCTAPTATAITGSAIGTTVLIGNNGYSTMVGTIHNNAINANHTPEVGGGNGIGGGNGVAGLGNAWTPDLTLTVTSNTITDTDGNGILLVGRGTSGTAKLTIKTNSVAAPLGGARPGIRVDAGNSASADDSVCLDISGNLSAGSGGSQGIGLRKQGTNATVNDFGIEGMVATSSPGVETFVDGQNPAGGGTLLISATSGFSNCSTAP